MLLKAKSLGDPDFANYPPLMVSGGQLVPSYGRTDTRTS